MDQKQDKTCASDNTSVSVNSTPEVPVNSTTPPASPVNSTPEVPVFRFSRLNERYYADQWGGRSKDEQDTTYITRPPSTLTHFRTETWFGYDVMDVMKDPVDGQCYASPLPLSHVVHYPQFFSSRDLGLVCHTSTTFSTPSCSVTEVEVKTTEDLKNTTRDTSPHPTTDPVILHIPAATVPLLDSTVSHDIQCGFKPHTMSDDWDMFAVYKLDGPLPDDIQLWPCTEQLDSFGPPTVLLRMKENTKVQTVKHKNEVKCESMQHTQWVWHGIVMMHRDALTDWDNTTEERDPINSIVYYAKRYMWDMQMDEYVTCVGVMDILRKLRTSKSQPLTLEDVFCSPLLPKCVRKFPPALVPPTYVWPSTYKVGRQIETTDRYHPKSLYVPCMTPVGAFLIAAMYQTQYSCDMDDFDDIWRLRNKIGELFDLKPFDSFIAQILVNPLTLILPVRQSPTTP